MARALALAVVALLAASALPLSQAWPTPGVNLSLERIVPEPYETNDFISYAEARAYLDIIAEAAPDYVEVVETGTSVGWDDPVGGSHQSWPVFAVEVTNEASAMPRADKRAVVFQLSIHGNEKGGREGGLRVIEDLAVPRLYGEEYRALLDEIIVVFTFPNVDGWNHEELPYRLDCTGYFPSVELPTGDCVDTQSYVRFNGHGQDMNRDWPTVGWYQTEFGREQALSEPEIAGLDAYLAQFKGRALSASDIHGMLNPADGGVKGVNPFLDGGFGRPIACAPENPANVECAREGHFVLGMIRGYQADAKLMLRDARLAEAAKQNLNAMAAERFPYWTSLPNLGFAGGEWMEFGTVWDTLGYSDSGFTGLWFAESLGAAGLDFELSYNHITFDNHYVPELNAMHVESVRTIVRTFLDEARDLVAPRLALEGSVAWLQDGRVVTNQGDAPLEGPHATNASDDSYERPYRASPQDFWRDLARYAPAGSLAPASAADVAAGRFHGHRTLVITGEAWDLVADDADALAHLRMHLQQGNRLLLTDSALRALETLELAAPGSVEEGRAYMGHVDLDLGHGLAKGIRQLARQTYESIALGYAIPEGGPVWTVAADALEGAQVAGTSLAPDRASVGVVRAGEGEVVFLGALLPAPTKDAYSPYGLASYAVSDTGYQLVYNALGITLEEVPGDGPEPLQPTSTPARVPGPAPWLVLALAGTVALALARGRRAARP